MKTFISALLLAIMPLCAQAQYTADLTLRGRQGTEKDNQNLVREYEKTQPDRVTGDVALSAAGKAAVADVYVNGINDKGNEDAYFKVNVGPGFALSGSYSGMYHRVPLLDYRLQANGQYLSSQSTYTWTGVVMSTFPGAPSFTGIAISSAQLTDLTNGQQMGFERKESFLKAQFYGDANNGDNAFVSFWQEDERGATPARYPGATTSLVSAGVTADQAYPADLDRATRELSFGLGLAMGDESAAAGDFTHRTFVENSNIVITSRAYTGLPIQVARPEYSENVTDTIDLRFRGTPVAGVPMTASLVSRVRTNLFNNFTARSYTGSLAGAYKLTKKIALDMRVNGRVYGVKEDKFYRNSFYGNTSGVAATTNFEDSINRYNFSGELNGRYEHSDKLAFKAGYKYENAYRRHADEYEEEFAGNALYEDGTYISSYTQVNGVSVREDTHFYTAGVTALLPWEIEAELNYKGSYAKEAIFESMPTNTNGVDTSFNVPLPYNLTLTADAGYYNEKNKKSSHSDSKMEQNAYQGGLSWQGPFGISVGADYSYDRTSYRNNGWFGTQNNPSGTVQLAALMREPNMLYRFENQVYGAHASAKLPLGFRLSGGGSYTMSKGKTPVSLDKFTSWNSSSKNINIDSGFQITDLTPSDTRMASANVALSYDYADWLGAQLGYRQMEWHDKIVTANSGKYSYADLSVTAKF